MWASALLTCLVAAAAAQGASITVTPVPEPNEEAIPGRAAFDADAGRLTVFCSGGLNGTYEGGGFSLAAVGISGSDDAFSSLETSGGVDVIGVYPACNAAGGDGVVTHTTSGGPVMSMSFDGADLYHSVLDSNGSATAYKNNAPLSSASVAGAVDLRYCHTTVGLAGSEVFIFSDATDIFYVFEGNDTVTQSDYAVFSAQSIACAGGRAAVIVQDEALVHYVLVVDVPARTTAVHALGAAIGPRWVFLAGDGTMSVGVTQEDDAFVTHHDTVQYSPVQTTQNSSIRFDPETGGYTIDLAVPAPTTTHTTAGPTSAGTTATTTATTAPPTSQGPITSATTTATTTPPTSQDPTTPTTTPPTSQGPITSATTVTATAAGSTTQQTSGGASRGAVRRDLHFVVPGSLTDLPSVPRFLGQFEQALALATGRDFSDHKLEAREGSIIVVVTRVSAADVGAVASLASAAGSNGGAVLRINSDLGIVHVLSVLSVVTNASGTTATALGPAPPSGEQPKRHSNTATGVNLAVLAVLGLFIAGVVVAINPRLRKRAVAKTLG